MKKTVLMLGLALGLFCSSKTQAQAPTAGFSLNQTTVCAGGTITATDMSTDSPTDWMYTLEGPAATSYSLQNPSFQVTAPGDYSLTLVATNGSGPSMPFLHTFTVLPLPTVSANGPFAICPGDYITLSGSGAATYAWSDGVIDGVAFPPAATDVYTVTGTDANGCNNWATVSVTVHALPVLSITGASSVCPNTAVSLTVSGADTYSWSTGAMTTSMSDVVTMNTIYNVTGTNTTTGCKNTATKQVELYPQPVVTVNSGAICAGKVFTMNPGGAASYVYTGGSNTVSPSANQSFTVTGTDANGCQAAAVSDVTVNPLPVISVSGGTVCSGAGFTLSPSGASTYSYLPGSSATVHPLSTTSYSVSGTDVNGCISAAPAVTEVTVVANPTITVNSGSICAGGVFTMTPTGSGLVFSYSSASNTVSPASDNTYTVTGQSNVGCVSAAVVSTVTVKALPVVTVNSGSICAGSVFTITPNGAQTYTFVNGSTTVNPVSSTAYSVSGTSTAGCISANYAISDVTVHALPVVSVTSGSICLGSAYTMTASGAATYTFEGGSATVSPASTSTYSVIGKSSLGCASSNTAVATITVAALPVLSVSGATAVCEGGSATLNASGAATFTWSASNATLTSYTVTPLVNTIYTLTGTDLNGCTNVTQHTVSVNPLPTITVNSGTICEGKSFTLVPNGALTYTVTGGTATVSPVANTTYSVIGTDANGCISAAAAVATVNVINTLTISVTGNTTICSGKTTQLTAAGATTYSWSTNVLTSTVSVSPSTTTSYTVTGTTSGCSNNAVVSVSVNAAPSLSASSTSTLLCNGETATLTIDGAASYQWNDGSTGTTLVVTPNVNTTYTVTGTDANACTATLSVVQNVGDCTGIASHEGNGIAVSIYPNPVNSVFTVKVTGDASMIILNAVGQVVYENTLVDGNNQVALNGQPNGIYFVQLKQGNDLKTVRIIKN